MTARVLTAVVIAAALSPCGLPAASPGEAPPLVPVAVDLAADARLSEERGLPILLVFTRAECGYCELLKSAVIEPVIISGEYESRAIIREVVVDSGTDLVDFEGRLVSPFSVADYYDALLTPTVLVVGPDAAELSERLVGINNVDMYLWYLNKAVAEAGAVLTASAAGER